MRKIIIIATLILSVVVIIFLTTENKKEKYQDWVDAISYSGFYDIDDYQKSKDIRNRLKTKMKMNCIGCSEETIHRIDIFAKDCFP